jgi:hypothetical protein
MRKSKSANFIAFEFGQGETLIEDNAEHGGVVFIKDIY